MLGTAIGGQLMRSMMGRPGVFVAAVGMMVGTWMMAPALGAQSPGPWKPLFNGKDLTGWTPAAGGGGRAGAPAPATPAPPPGTWKVENGVLIAGEGGGRG